MALFWTLPLILTSFLSLAPKAYADSNLEVATDSNFSSQTTNFSAGQTIYVRLSSESTGDKKKVLNIRDNQYNFIQSHSLNKTGDKFSTSFSAPQNEGYYSLEAQVESDGNNTTSVKTIKVGIPQNANVKVSIKNNASGQSVTTKTPSPSPSSRGAVEGSADFDAEASPNIESPDIKIDQKPQEPQPPSFFGGIVKFLQNIFSTIWHFKLSK